MQALRYAAAVSILSVCLAGAALAQTSMAPGLTNTPATSSKDSANNTLTGKTPGTGNIQTQNTVAMKHDAQAKATADSARMTGTATTPPAQ